MTDSDRLSQCTTATTASLASRLASLAMHPEAAGGGLRARDLGAARASPRLAPAPAPAAAPAGTAAALPSSTSGDDDDHAEDEEEEVVELSEAAILAELDALEPAWCVAARLFKEDAVAGGGGERPPLKRLTWAALDALRSRGYAVVDGILTEAQAGEVRAAVLAARAAGALVDAGDASAAAAFPAAPGARSDAIAWLPGEAGLAAPHPALSHPAIAAARDALADVAADVRRAVRLALPPGAAGEVQVAAYPPGGRYVRHRDALPDDGGGGEEEGGEDEGLAQRRVTVVLYANPGWRADHGGKLRLWPPVGLGEGGEEEESSSEEEEGEGAVGRAALPASVAAAAPGAPAPSSVVAEPTEAASDVASLVGGGGGGGPATPRATHAPGAAGSPLPRPPTTAASDDDNGDGDTAAPVPTGGTAELGPEAAVDVAPLAGRAVLFMSGAVEHAVLATGGVDRVAVTAWLR